MFKTLIRFRKTLETFKNFDGRKPQQPNRPAESAEGRDLGRGAVQKKKLKLKIKDKRTKSKIEEQLLSHNQKNKPYSLSNF